MYFSDEQIENVRERVIIKLRQDNRLNEDEDTVRALVVEEFGEEKVTVMHEKNSHKKYGDATEYGFASWMDYCYKYSPNNKSLKLIKRCPSCGEPMIDADGAHVINPISREVFITPTCSSCNSKAAQDEAFRARHRFKVKAKHLVPFNYDELKKLRHSK